MIFHKVLTAVEIERGSVKILEVEKKKNGYLLNNFLNNTIAGAEPREISIELNNIFLKNKIRRKNVYTNIKDNSVWTYHLLLPEMPENDLIKAVEYEIKKKLPFPVSSATFDYIYTYSLNPDTSKNIKITVFVTKKEDIDLLNAIFTNSGIKLKSIECKTTSIFNAYLYVHGNRKGHYLLCDINSSVARIMIIYDNSTSFERILEDPAIAEHAINKLGNIIGSEIKKTVDFYYAGKSIEPIENIYLSGIYSYAPEFIKNVSSIAELPVKTDGIINLMNRGLTSGVAGKMPFIPSGKKLLNNNHNDDYDNNTLLLSEIDEQFIPLTDMWTTFGLIANR